MARKRSKKKKTAIDDRRVFFGVGLIFLGVMFLARNLGIIPDDLANYWPVILVLLGLWGLSNGLN